MPHLTTNAHELALSIIFESGLTHFADSVEAYESLPDEVRDFLRDIPVVWDETQYIAGEPGDFIVLARRIGYRWFVAGINGQDEARDITLDLSSLTSIYRTRIIEDGVDRLSFNTRMIDEMNSSMQLTMQPYGGFVIYSIPTEPAQGDG